MSVRYEAVVLQVAVTAGKLTLGIFTADGDIAACSLQASGNGAMQPGDIIAFEGPKKAPEKWSGADWHKALSDIDYVSGRIRALGLGGNAARLLEARGQLALSLWREAA